ncbi:hypothetical protein GQ53DRAFT_781712 [Thozetella sp. PMI_491]|nr:hypothetical protein GQ53DRAFT_781712 [Thozetella sp. PMI_491]
MAMGAGIMDFVQRFQTLQLQRDTSDELIKDLLIYAERIEATLRQENNRLQGELSNSQLDLADATKSRRELQQLLQQLETRNASISQDNHYLKSHNPYVVVLIDGDGLLFKESLVRQGREGGKAAAYALRSAILRECGEHAKDIEVIAKCYSDLGGLGKSMRCDGCLDNETDLRDFWQGFTQGELAFDFVDIGHSNERAGHKLKETTKWNLRNYNCKQVILGVSHDARYGPYLDELFQDDMVRRRVTILEGHPTARELVATGVNILNLTDTLFRSDKLVDRTPRHPSPRPVASIGAASVASSAPTPATSTTSTPAQPPAPSPASYAHAIGNTTPPLPPPPPPPPVTLPLQPRAANASNRPAPQKPQLWNPGRRGLDPPIQVSQAALESIKKRKDSNKLCNNHYLRGPCAKGDSCCFEHKYRPSKDEINAIAFLTRLNPCANGQECEVEDCIYGHHCPSVRDGQCTHPYCKFQESDHPPGTRYKSRSFDH